ncbi:ATP-binding cassette subfamily B protein [Bacillus oleivorans]|uniref:ATP-binding cassette subfamily B protein n=1 Tax=Bacillus oleivorans TaxID=1448271 RepID=A0A285CR24_9BACI|nr:ABC transporter ATP-binding protein [Bacillus oleivorans]SNX69982.1 ATP-binding cassette subfamily B protein [Bacillus oleivorans]
MSTGKRLVQYALKFKMMIIFALVMLSVSVGAELMGPFIAKKLIDDHIIGIESPWYETTQGEEAVNYNGTFYKRGAYFEEGEEKGSPARILQIQKDFIFVPSEIEFDGKRTFADGILTISNGDVTREYSGTKLNTREVMAFYQPEVPKIMILISAYFGLLVFASFFQYGQRFYLQKAANRIIQKMRNDVFQHISRLPIQYFDNLPAGKVVSRITNDTEAIRELYVAVLANFFTSIIYIIGVFIGLFILDPTLAAWCLLLVPILFIWMKLYRKYASVYNHVIRSKVSEINGMLNESIQGMSIIQAFRREKEMKQEFEALNDEHFQYQNKLLNLNSLTGHNLTWMLRNIVFVAFIWYFGGQSLGIGTVVSLGVLYAIVDYITRLFEPVNGIVNQLANLEQALVAGERVFQLMDEEGTPVSDEEIPRLKGHVQFEQVSFAYKEEDYVLKDIDFEAKPGQTVALVGHTGSGKSSILNLLFRYYDSQKGAIKIDGKDVKDLPKQALRKHMAIVLQDPFLFTGTIASNISMDDDKITRKQMEMALKAVGGDQILKHLEKGLDEPVIEKGSTLSSGQRQLISFARALAFDPAILVLDEATSNIDTETEAVIQKAMDVLKKGRTTFIIAHRLSTIKNADLILVLDRGQIVERGNHEQLMNNGGKYYQMYQLQKGGKSSLAV